jgi:PAS domain-containing protein
MAAAFPVEVNMKWVWLDRDYIVAVVRDISERRKSEAALRSSEERLRACIDNTPNVAVQWYDEAGRVLYWNAASENIFGWSQDEAVGKTLDQLIQTPGGGGGVPADAAAGQCDGQTPDRADRIHFPAARRE